jgi:hypothetical protein
LLEQEAGCFFAIGYSLSHRLQLYNSAALARSLKEQPEPNATIVLANCNDRNLEIPDNHCKGLARRQELSGAVARGAGSALCVV